jgi:hypothetical protein
MVKKAMQAVVVLVGMLLIACNSEDAFVGEDGSTPTGVAGSVATLTLLASSTQLGSSGDSAVTITAITKDSNNNLLADVPVSFSASSGSLAVAQAGGAGGTAQSTTNEAGQVAATLTPGGDYANRTITVNATAGGKTAQVNVSVTGTNLAISGETSATIGDSTPLVIVLRDSSNDPIPNQAITVSSARGNSIGAASLTTNSAGEVPITVAASVAGTDTITASAQGATASHSLVISGDQFRFTAPLLNATININACTAVTASWQQNGTPKTGETISFSATRGVLYSDSGCATGATSAVTDGSGVATLYVKSNNAGPSTLTAFVAGGPTTSRAVSFVATTPASIDLQASPATIGPNNGSQTQQQQSTITAIVRDADNNLVANKLVRFSIVTDNSGGTLTTATATTNSLGRASTSYVSSAATTAQNGVTIKAEMDSSPGINKTVSLTVAQSPLFVRLGTGNLISTVGQTQYDKKYTAIVTDASGNAAANVSVSLSANPVWFTKGSYRYDDTASSWVQIALDNTFTEVTGLSPQLSPPVACESEDANENGILDTGEDKNKDGELDPGEDLNGNGTLDAGEDIGDGQLTPGNVVSVPTTVTTGADGTIEFSVIYPKQFANWVRIRLTATTSVAGTESSDNAVFWLPIATADLTDKDTAPPGTPSPFGRVTGDCTTTD